MRGTPVMLRPVSEPLAMAASSWARCAAMAVEIVTCAALERICCSYVAACPPRIRASWAATPAGSVTVPGSATSASTVPASTTSARPGRLSEASRVPLAASSDTSVSPGVAAISVVPPFATHRRSTAPPAVANGTSVIGVGPPEPAARRSPALMAVSSDRTLPDAVPT